MRSDVLMLPRKPRRDAAHGVHVEHFRSPPEFGHQRFRQHRQINVGRRRRNGKNTEDTALIRYINARSGVTDGKADEPVFPADAQTDTPLVSIFDGVAEQA